MTGPPFPPTRFCAIECEFRTSIPCRRCSPHGCVAPCSWWTMAIPVPPFRISRLSAMISGPPRRFRCSVRLDIEARDVRPSLERDTGRSPFPSPLRRGRAYRRAPGSERRRPHRFHWLSRSSEVRRSCSGRRSKSRSGRSRRATAATSIAVVFELGYGQVTRQPVATRLRDHDREARRIRDGLAVHATRDRLRLIDLDHTVDGVPRCSPRAARMRTNRSTDEKHCCPRFASSSLSMTAGIARKCKGRGCWIAISFHGDQEPGVRTGVGRSSCPSISRQVSSGPLGPVRGPVGLRSRR